MPGGLAEDNARFILLACVLGAYMLAGAALFQRLESDLEIKQVNTNEKISVILHVFLFDSAVEFDEQVYGARDYLKIESGQMIYKSIHLVVNENTKFIRISLSSVLFFHTF